MTPVNAPTNETDEGLVNSKVIGYLLLALASSPHGFDFSYFFWSQFFTGSKLLCFVLAIVCIRAAKPVGRIVANAVIAGMQNMQRIRVKAVNNEPTDSGRNCVDCLYCHLASHLTYGATYRSSPRPAFIGALLINLFPVTDFLFVS